MSQDQQYKLKEMDFRLHRLERELLCMQLSYEMALATRKPAEILEELRLDVENLKRKVNWFAGAINRYMKHFSFKK